MWMFLDDDPDRSIVGSQRDRSIPVVDHALHGPIAASSMYPKLAGWHLADHPAVDRERVESTTGSRSGAKIDVTFGRGDVDRIIEGCAGHDVHVASCGADVDRPRYLAQVNIAQARVVTPSISGALTVT